MPTDKRLITQTKVRRGYDCNNYQSYSPLKSVYKESRDLSGYYHLNNLSYLKQFCLITKQGIKRGDEAHRWGLLAHDTEFRFPTKNSRKRLKDF